MQVPCSVQIVPRPDPLWLVCWYRLGRRCGRSPTVEVLHYPENDSNNNADYRDGDGNPCHKLRLTVEHRVVFHRLIVTPRGYFLHLARLAAL